MIEPKLKTNIKGLKKLTEEYPAASRDARKARLTEALLLLERVVKEKTPEGAGPIHLRDSFFSTVDWIGDQFKGIFGTPLAHGEPVEYGTKPHFPPIAPLQHWVEKILGLEGKKARSVAFAIAIIRSRSSRLGVHMVDKGFTENEARILEILKRIPDDIIKAVGA